MAGEIAVPPTPQEPSASPAPAGDLSDKFSIWILNLGFLFALIISAICFVFSARYLDTYLAITSSSVDKIVQETAGQPLAMQLALAARLAVAKYSLSSCGVVAGLAFGFLGFALFLLGIKGAMDAQGSFDKSSIQLVRVAPGTFVLVCATILIGVSITHRIDFSSEQALPLHESNSGNPTNPLPAPQVGHDPIP
jgi:hypothetical protein